MREPLVICFATFLASVTQSKVVGKRQRSLNQRELRLNEATILVLGVTYKADTGDPHQSPAIKVMELLQKEGAQLIYLELVFSARNEVVQGLMTISEGDLEPGTIAK